MENNTSMIENIIGEVKKEVFGKDEVIYKMLMAVLVNGHILIEDIPGLGKTTLAKAFAKVLGLECNRIQFTPDVMPSDITGFSMYNRQKNIFEYKPGAAMCNILLADEINRTSPKTQAALLEIMEEKTVTIEGNSIELPKPFIVMATQNPYGSAGTQKLPESQLDRFMLCMSMGYPKAEDEIMVLKNSGMRQKAKKVIDVNEFIRMQQVVDNMYVNDEVYDYIVKIINITRNSSDIKIGISPRGGIAVLSMAKARAFLRGHDYVAVSDVNRVFTDVCAHRIELEAEAIQKGKTPVSVLEMIIKGNGN